MEVVVSAAVLILIVLGVMAAVDAVAGTAGANKARTVAAVLAEKDQEELRSLKTADLNRLEDLIPAPREVVVDGVPYTITSEAKLVTDARGEDISCALDDGEGSFVRITSTVTSPMTGAKVKPVKMSSIVAPEPGSGTLVAMVRDAEDDPVVNMPVEANGPEIKTVRTNEAGCAVFGAVESGSYEVQVDQLGWVDPDGYQEVIKSATVAAGTLATVEFLYDIGATVTVNVATTPASTVTPPPAQADDSHGIIAGHNWISTTYRMFPGEDVASPPAASTHVLTGLFPFHEDEYTLYSGRCTDADPIGGTRPDDYFDLLEPGGAAVDATPALTPGERRTITIYEQAINLNATFSRTIQNSRVYATPTTSGCGPRIDLGRVVSGKAERPGVPFGSYNVCVQFQRTSPDNRWYRLTVPVTVDRSPGTPVINVPVTTSTPSTQATCA